jgi:hypothetical protein
VKANVTTKLIIHKKCDIIERTISKAVTNFVVDNVPEP